MGRVGCRPPSEQSDSSDSIAGLLFNLSERGLCQSWRFPQSDLAAESNQLPIVSTNSKPRFFVHGEAKGAAAWEAAGMAAATAAEQAAGEDFSARKLT